MKGAATFLQCSPVISILGGVAAGRTERCER